MFGGLFGKAKSKAKADTAPKLSSAIASSITNTVGARSIPAMPKAAQKSFELSTDPNAEARDFIEVIESDEALSARVLKIANSVYFDRGHASTTIEESVLVIGINELRCLLNATALNAIFPTRHPARTQLWANDIATALIARNIAQQHRPSQAELAFLGGLMHDVGKLLLLQRQSDDYSKIIRSIETTGVDFCKAEEELFVFNHCEAGQLIAEKWNFSPELTAMIRNHHDPLPEVTESKGGISLSLIVQCADLMAHALGLGHPKGMSKFRSHAEDSLPKVWALLGVGAEEQKPTLERYRKAFDLEYDLYAGNDV